MNMKDDIQKALLEQLGISGWPEDKQQEAIVTVGGPLLQAVTVAIFEKIPAEKRAELQAAMESADAARIGAIINTHIPNSTEFIESEVSKSLAEIKKLKGN